MNPIRLTNQAVIGLEWALVWSDGREDYLPLELLRRACPCASCQGEPDAMGRVVRPPVNYNERSFQLLNVEMMGGYALKPVWGDGHNTGLYSFDYLRELGEATRL